MLRNLERRSGQRFPIRMHVAYRLFLKEDGRILSQGKGQTVDISHTGVLLNTPQPYPVGAAAEMLIEWPPSSDHSIPVHLRLVGWVVRSDEHGTAVKILRHSFKGRHGEFLSTKAVWPDLSKELLAEPQEI